MVKPKLLTMKKRFLFFFILTLFTKSIFSQVTHSISIGPDIGVGANFGKSSKASIGGSFEYAVHFSPQIGIRLSTGYNKFNGKYFDDYVSFYTIRGGLQSFIYQDIFFVFADAGTATYKSSNPDPALTKFSWATGAGYRQTLGQGQFLQFSAKFNFFRHNPHLTYTWFNFRAAYGFSFGKKNKVKEE
jgi:hypothetical protein